MSKMEKEDEALIEKLKMQQPRKILLYFILPVPAVVYVILTQTIPAVPAFALFLAGMMFGIAIEKSFWERIRKIVLKLTAQ